jgi:hypothetical protein
MTSPRTHDTPTVAVVIPLAQLTDGERPVVRRHAGRPRRVATAPTLDERLYLDSVADAVETAIERDPLVLASSGDDPVGVLDLAIAGVAAESAALGWERERAQREGRVEAERISSRRVQALLRLADLVVAREQLRREDGELDPAQLERLVSLLLGAVREAAEETCGEQAEMFLERLGQKMASANFPAGTSAA